jgi:hypothetical protein
VLQLERQLVRLAVLLLVVQLVRLLAVLLVVLLVRLLAVQLVAQQEVLQEARFLRLEKRLRKKWSSKGRKWLRKQLKR